jgi:hypothetical protein
VEGLAVAVLAHVITVIPIAAAGAIAAGLMGAGLRHLSRAVGQTDEELALANGTVATDGQPSQ